jgi:hypothetical protein
MALLALACASPDEGSGTTGKTITVAARAVVTEKLDEAKVNDWGWSVSLSQAYLAVGPLYVYPGDPVLSRSGTAPKVRSVWARVNDLLVPEAFAHPGHYVSGDALVQLKAATSLDLLTKETPLGTGTGVTGFASSASFGWTSPAKGPHAAELGEHVIWAQGSAKRAEQTVHFIAKAKLEDVLDGDQRPEVAGCRLGETPGDVGVELTGDGTLTLHLQPSVWFREVDFALTREGAAASTAENPIDLSGSMAWRAFVRGAKKGTAYLFSFRREP